MTSVLPLRSILSVCITVISILFIPLIAMKFTNEVNWGIGDFIVAGLLLSIVGFGIALLIHHMKPSRKRIVAIGAIIIFIVFLWVELAVGIIG